MSSISIHYESQGFTVSSQPWSATANYVANKLLPYNGQLYVSKNAITGSAANMNPSLDTANWFLLLPRGSAFESSLLDALGQMLVRSDGQDRALNIGNQGQVLSRVGQSVIWKNRGAGASRSQYLPLSLTETNAPRSDTTSNYQMCHHTFVMRSSQNRITFAIYTGRVELGRTGRAQFDFGGSQKDKIRIADRDFYMRKPHGAPVNSDSADGYIANGRFYYPNMNLAYGRFWRSAKSSGAPAIDQTQSVYGGNNFMTATTYNQINRLEEANPATRSLLLGIQDDGNWSQFQDVIASDGTIGLRVLDWIRTDSELFIFICNPLSGAADSATRDIYAVGGIDFSSVTTDSELASPPSDSVLTEPSVTTTRGATQRSANVTPYGFRLKSITRISATSGNYQKLYLYDHHNMYSSNLRLPVSAAVDSRHFLVRNGDGAFERWAAVATSNRVGLLTGVTNRDHVYITEHERRGANATRGIGGRETSTNSWASTRAVLSVICAIRAYRATDTSITVAYVNDTPNNLAEGAITVASLRLAYPDERAITLNIPDGQTIDKVRGIQYPTNNGFTYLPNGRAADAIALRSFDAAIFVTTTQGNVYAARLGNSDPSNLFEAIEVLDFSTIAAGESGMMTHFSNSEWDGMVKDLVTFDTENLAKFYLNDNLATTSTELEGVGFVHNRCVGIVTRHSPNRVFVHGLNRTNVPSEYSVDFNRITTYTHGSLFFASQAPTAQTVIGQALAESTSTTSHNLNSTSNYVRITSPVETIDRLVFGALTAPAIQGLAQESGTGAYSVRLENHVYMQSGEDVYISKINADGEIAFVKMAYGSQSLYLASGATRNFGYRSLTGSISNTDAADDTYSVAGVSSLPNNLDSQAEDQPLAQHLVKARQPIEFI